MADKDEDLDLDAKPASNKKMIIIIAVVGLLLIAGSVGVTIMLLGGDEEQSAEEAVAEEPAVPETHYLALDKMVITFSNPGGAKFLQVEMELMAHDKAVLDVVKEHMPVVKNDLLVLLSGQDSDSLRSLEGKETLRGEILTAVQKIVKDNADLDGPQSVYFTSFVMQ
jgi:flagellar FliL protein